MDGLIDLARAIVTKKYEIIGEVELKIRAIVSSFHALSHLDDRRESK